MKLADGVTVLEADVFEGGNEIFIVTEDEQKIPVPVGEYVLTYQIIITRILSLIKK